MEAASTHYTAVVIGSGFGGTMTALPLAREFSARGQGESLLMLERGTWWTTPVGTVQDKEVKTYDFLVGKQQAVQFWSSAEHFRGFVDIFTRCVRRKNNEDGLYELTNFGRRGLLGLGLSQNDGVTILRACGVGGGSLVYANVTIQPPDLVFDDPRWTVSWDQPTRNGYYDLARDAIGFGVLYALHQRDAAANPATPGPVPAKVNTGLSNIVARTARLDPRWMVKPDPNNKRGVKQLDPAHSTAADNDNALWIDRARVFQTEMSALTNDYGTVDSSINDINPEPGPFDPAGAPKNYCERQGRCIIGCLPGARHTLNKQLMSAILGTPQGAAPLFPDMQLQPLAEVDVIHALPDGRWQVDYLQRDATEPERTTRRSVTADRVILAAGCVGTNEILLRCRQRGTIPHLSDHVGYGFSTNGDYLAFLDETKQHISLTRGPVTTSFAHFNTPGAAGTVDPAKFHTIEDNGIPRAFSVLTGQGVPLLQSLSKGRHPKLFLLWAMVRYVLGRIPRYLLAPLRNYEHRQEEFTSEDEQTANMMCIAAMGREASIGQFRLGGRRDTTLRVKRTDGKAFHEDPIYTEIDETLSRFARRLTDDPQRQFINPFITPTAGALGSKSIGLSHPIGGCRMAPSAEEGVVDEHGRVFDTSKAGQVRPFHEGLYVTDAARIPTALGVNPSLTIAALALRTADKIIEELPAAAASPPTATPGTGAPAVTTSASPGSPSTPLA
jgi:choline dehydrogenase-like flavoprotein